MVPTSPTTQPCRRSGKCTPFRLLSVRALGDWSTQPKPGMTVTRMGLLIAPPPWARTVVMPSSLGVKTPRESMMATEGSLDDQERAGVGTGFPEVSMTVAEKARDEL